MPGGSSKAIVASDTVRDAVVKVEAMLGKAGRVVLRPSGTEPVIRVMVEGEQRCEVDSLTHELVEAVKLAAS